jgi:hypothetical protein
VTFHGCSCYLCTYPCLLILLPLLLLLPHRGSSITFSHHDIITPIQGLSSFIMLCLLLLL